MKYLKFLSEQKGWGWEFEVHPEFSRDVIQSAAAVKVAPSLSSKILPQLTVLPTQVRSIECLDSFFKENGTWYPRLLLHEALRLVFVGEARDLDIRAPAFVVGDGDEARIVSSVLAEMGVGDIYLVGDAGRLQSQKEILARSQLGIRFHVLLPDDLTLQAVSAGVVVNTVDLSKQKSLLTDLSYFNFMKRAGYALDLNILPAQNLLLEEAEKAELRVLPPVLVAAILTRLWLDRLEVGSELSPQDIRETWMQFLKQSSS
ncbi:hypothetical protein [Bdellovibrio sp. HCB-110]|uniref:hypothetical protein n=1 Tax=Bdellovibrio sp. HCB-110 TaxID=3391182 RepID=UPI0039B5C2B3